jgi:ribosomal protein S6
MVKSQTKEKKIVERVDGQRYLLTILAEEESALGKLEEFLKASDVKLEKIENLGRRSLVFPIKKHHELMLMSAFFVCDPSVTTPLEKKLQHEDFIVRMLLTTWDAEVAEFSERGKRVRKDV